MTSEHPQENTERYPHRLLLIAAWRGGGIEHFCQILLRNLSPNFQAEFLEVGNRPNSGLLAKALDLVNTVAGLASRLKSKRVDLIHINVPFRSRGLLRESLHLILVKRRSYLCKTIVFFHGWDTSLGERLVRLPILAALFRRLYGNAALIFVLHATCKEQLVTLGISDDRIRVTTTMYEKLPESPLDGRFERTGQIGILFMARLVLGKGPLVAAQVARLLLDSGHGDFHMTIAGEGPLRQELEAFIADNDLHEYVRLTGYVDGEEKANLLRTSSIFLLPTDLQEGCPIAILEAMGAGQAIVTTARGGIPDVVEDGTNGFILGDPEAGKVCKAVLRLLQDGELLRKIMKSNASKAAKEYEAADFMRRLEKVYAAVVEGRMCERPS